MSASLLYHTNGINSVHYKKARFEKNSIFFEVEMKKNCSTCKNCGNLYSNFKGKKLRRLRMVPFGNKTTFLDLHIHRLECKRCKYIWWPNLSFMAGKKRMTRSLIQYILDLMQFGTIRDVALFIGVAWDVVKDIHKDALKRIYKNIEYKELRHLGIDEFSIRKGYDYMTIITDLETGRIIYAVEGRNNKDVAPFLKKLAKKAINLKAFAMDMSSSYASAVRETLPKVKIVLDHYHVTALINLAIDDLRREQQGKCNQIGLKAIKGVRFLLLRNYDRLYPEGKNSLESLLETNKPLATAYAMKEQFRLFWTKENSWEGARFLATWIIDALETDIRQIVNLGRTFLRHWEGLINYFENRLTNSKTEGINNKIKTLKRQAYGYRDMEYFKLRLYHLHNQRYALTG
jgi:transposase